MGEEEEGEEEGGEFMVGGRGERDGGKFLKRKKGVEEKKGTFPRWNCLKGGEMMIWNVHIFCFFGIKQN